MNVNHPGQDVAHEIQKLLFELAIREEELACAEAAGTPYWAPMPEAVIGHRAAARALRAQAEAIPWCQAA